MRLDPNSDARKKIRRFINKMPGLHLREIQRELNIPLGTLNYHLRCLEKSGTITSKKEGKYKRYCPMGEITAVDREILSILRQTIPRRIILCLLVNPDITKKNISGQLGIRESTTMFHLRKLMKYNLVKQEKQGRENIYSVVNEVGISRILISHKPKFW
ncbi:MAG: winged helix-turn-helix transcriptional regulator [Thermoplasmata archaeon]